MSITLDLANNNLDINTKVEQKEFLNGYENREYIQKRVIDYIVVTTLFLLVWPIIIYTIYRIKKESPGPIFYKQTRVGLHGKKFTCYKFRSMHSDSHHNPYTQDNDSRIFPFGQIMRKVRIDELAQFFNVFKGDMHLVGPRAEWDILVHEYEGKITNYHMRHSVRPGITGLAQVKYPYGRNVYDAKQKLSYDINYIKKWSVWVEFKVMIETILVIFRKSGV
jgi:lipopolysaccharide/colanic/teichoic acid biosynthesis glycosyltransferase